MFDQLNADGRTIVLITHEHDVAGPRAAADPAGDGRIVADEADRADVTLANLFGGRFALRGLSANKLRSRLTVLGILIGVGAVILLVAVGNGSGRRSRTGSRRWARTR